MASEEKKMNQYIKAVKRRLNLPSDIKKRVMNDFICSIESRREAGKQRKRYLQSWVKRQMLRMS